MQQEDTLPWYRQFWPWFLIALPGLAVVAGIYTLFLAISTQDALVVQSSDLTIGKAKESILAAERKASDLGLLADITINPDTGLITARMTALDAMTSPVALELDFSHPAFAERDQTVMLARALPDEDGNPTWSGHFAVVPEGRWYVVLESGDEWRLNGVWAGESQLVLRPASGNER
jgi:hypothetical protein